MFICIGLGIGTTCGYLIGSWLARDRISVPCMKAIACVSYKSKDVSPIQLVLIYQITLISFVECEIAKVGTTESAGGHGCADQSACRVDKPPRRTNRPWIWPNTAMYRAAIPRQILSRIAVDVGQSVCWGCGGCWQRLSQRIGDRGRSVVCGPVL